MQKIAVLFGGKSNENEISILTGVFVLNLIDKEKFIPVPVYIHTDGEMYTSAKMNDLNLFKKQDFSSFSRIFFDGGTMYAFNAAKTKVKNKGKIDGAINCCHGGLGEGGGISALMQLNEIPLASPELTASGMFMDKTLTKLVAKALNIPTVEYIRVNESDYARRGKFLLKNIGSKLKYPVVVKPAHLGSSIGISLAENEEGAEKAIEAAFLLDERVIIEKYIKGKRDINCAAYSLNGEIFVSEPEEASSGDKLYTFADKYLKDGNRPRAGGKRGGGAAVLSDETRENIRSYTRTLYKRMNLKGIVRMDFLLGEGKIYLGEVNTVPGSLAYYLFCERVSDAKNLFSDLIEDAVKSAEAEKKHVISTGILQTVSVRGKSRGVRL
ncbi:MAG: ATP-grasp domain-containing protein [Firmicutes bacterium]|jgi:D-ala D-ala ligase N-terminal domain protein|nr:ATP-grasp domain-containing protein [Bacillota bacterium]